VRVGRRQAILRATQLGLLFFAKEVIELLLQICEKGAKTSENGA
jgi:hypothetical protein